MKYKNKLTLIFVIDWFVSIIYCVWCFITPLFLLITFPKTNNYTISYKILFLITLGIWATTLYIIYPKYKHAIYKLQETQKKIKEV